MKYLFTTLAVGDEYLNNSIECYTQMSKTLNCDYNITTNKTMKNTNNINFDYFTLERYEDDKPGFSFYLNLKVLALKYAINKGYDFVIYNDADWLPTTNLKEENMSTLFEYMINGDYDMLFERPANIEYYKNNIEECFFKEKLLDFNVLEHSLWDSAHCMNEQFLVFKVNWKFKMFVMKWEMFLWYSIVNNIRSYPDGFDIGVSALESKMKWDYSNWFQILRDCFTFKDKFGNTFNRF